MSVSTYIYLLSFIVLKKNAILPDTVKVVFFNRNIPVIDFSKYFKIKNFKFYNMNESLMYFLYV